MALKRLLLDAESDWKGTPLTLCAAFKPSFPLRTGRKCLFQRRKLCVVAVSIGLQEASPHAAPTGQPHAMGYFLVPRRQESTFVSD